MNFPNRIFFKEQRSRNVTQVNVTILEGLMGDLGDHEALIGEMGDHHLMVEEKRKIVKLESIPLQKNF